MEDQRPLILLVDDDRAFARELADLMADRFRVETAGSVREAEAALARASYDAMLLDLDLGRGTDGFDVLDRIRASDLRLPVIMVTKDASLPSAVTALKKGAVEYIDKRPDVEDLGRRIERALAEQRLATRSHALAREVEEAWGPMIGSSPAMRRLREAIAQAATGVAAVLVVGETGTGKELVARSLHRDGRHPGPFRAVNCAAIPRDLVESELFGSERGAFTSATRRITGAFEEAREGMLFLDEITEMDPAVQAKLLRVVEERSFQRLGGGPRVAFRGRVVASTNRDPEAAVREGVLRQDLYYRLATFVVRVPPLRERREDIPALIEHFVARKSWVVGAAAAPLDEETMRRLCAYDWPGNVRQLQSAIERYLTGAPVLERAVGGAAAADAAGLWTDDLLTLPYDDAKTAVLHRFQRRYLEAVLAAHGGRIQAAADSIGVSGEGLRKMLRGLEGGAGAGGQDQP
jgi:DNA-binding NtrC family response regulator